MGITCMGKWCLWFHHTRARMTKKSFQRVKKKFLMGISKLQLLTLIGHHGGKSLLKFFFFTSWSRYQNTLSSFSVILALKKPELQNNLHFGFEKCGGLVLITTYFFKLPVIDHFFICILFLASVGLLAENKLILMFPLLLHCSFYSKP